MSFVGALQASIPVLLSIFCGVIAAQFGLLSTGAAEEVSKLCVKLLLPCLLISNLGSELHLDTVLRCVPIIGMRKRPLACNPSALSTLFIFFVSKLMYHAPDIGRG